MSQPYIAKRKPVLTKKKDSGYSSSQVSRMIKTSTRSYAKNSDKPLTIKTTVIGPTLAADPLGTSPQNNYSSFDLSNIPDWAAYQQLYDQVKLNKITVRFYPTQTGLDAGTFQSQKQQNAAFVVAAIPDNTLTLNTMSLITQVGSHRRGDISSPMTYTFTPKMIVQKNIRATSGFFQNINVPENDWIMLSTSSSQVSYHGIYTLFDTWSFVAPAVGTPIPAMRTEVTYTLSFRNMI